MAFKLCSFIVLIFVLLPVFCVQALPSKSNSTKPEPFEFLKHLKGCHKGKTVKGVHDLKQYLERFGYLHYDKVTNSSHAVDDDFDELLESAIKTYQLNYHLNSTGTLDSETVTKMMMPRCGVPDIINGTSAMRSGKNKQHRHSSGTLHTVSHYSFFPGLPKWPSTKTHLTYAFLPSARKDILSPVCARAFGRWSSVTHFTFEEVQDYRTSDLTIGVHGGAHGDGNPFDGRGGTLAHAFAPTDGRFHYDADENWANGPVVGSFDLETVALHEIGHLLGLEHSSVEGAIMYPSIPSGVKKDLHGDDVQGIKALYNR
ncbi:hypothetical protein IFM89_029475 [Coptis chinensis]|uniref:Peptidase metallopeptidase domain-containing protein n=1 Tax=Coptis chinensis TaxID=261450 RepID=A0A835HY60_9MAGN|nr:hypothetical protein IFM89_029475 [Coptis chinensis]